MPLTSAWLLVGTPSSSMLGLAQFSRALPRLGICTRKVASGLQCLWTTNRNCPQNYKNRFHCFKNLLSLKRLGHKFDDFLTFIKLLVEQRALEVMEAAILTSGKYTFYFLITHVED